MKNTMINAKEANARSNKTARELVNAFIEKVVAPKILESIEDGKFLASFFVKKDDKVNADMLVEYLKELGYGIFYNSHIDNSRQIGISWRDEDVAEEVIFVEKEQYLYRIIIDFFWKIEEIFVEAINETRAVEIAKDGLLIDYVEDDFIIVEVKEVEEDYYLGWDD